MSQLLLRRILIKGARDSRWVAEEKFHIGELLSGGDEFPYAAATSAGRASNLDTTRVFIPEMYHHSRLVIISSLCRIHIVCNDAKDSLFHGL